MFVFKNLFSDSTGSYHTWRIHVALLPTIFCHLLQLRPKAGRGQNSGLMGKWEMGCYQANKAPQSVNQIRKQGVCVLQRESMCVFLYVCEMDWGLAYEPMRGLMAVVFLGDSGVRSFRRHLEPWGGLSGSVRASVWAWVSYESRRVNI